MIDNTFSTTFFRLETPKTTNEETFFVDENGKLIYTTPFFTSENLTFDKLVFSTAINTPSNVNLIVDCLTIFSTNPNVQNYLPLTLTIGQNPSFEFCPEDFTEMSDYHILVDPPINLQTIKNRRYADPLDRVFAVTNLTDLVNVSQQGTDIYFDLIVGGRQVWYFDLTTSISTQVAGIVPIALKSNSVSTYVLTSRNPTAISIINGGTATPLIGLADPVIDFKQSGNSLYVFTQRTPTTVDIYLYVKNSTSNVVTLVDIWSIVSTSVWFAVNIYTTNTFFVFREPNVISQYQLLSNSGVEETVLNMTPRSVGDSFAQIFAGGSNQSVPIISIFNHNQWEFIDRLSDVQTLTSIKSIKNPVLNSNVDRFDNRIKRIGNTVYLVDQNIQYFFNLDQNRIVTYDATRSAPILPRTLSQVSTNFDNSCYLDVTLNGAVILFSVFENKREVQKVFKLTHSYEHKHFLYHVNSERFPLNITLKDATSIANMEIFKMVLDFRILYSIQKMVFNPTKPSTASTNRPLPTKDKKVTKKDKQILKDSRVVGDTKRLLGLVPSDFNVVDFLHLYS